MKHTPITSSFAAMLTVAVWFAAAPLEAQARNDPAFRRLLPCCRVIAVDAAASRLSVRDERTGKVFEMFIQGPSTRKAAMSGTQYRPGQTVFIDVAGNRAAVATFPVTVTRKDNIERTSWKMETTVTLSNTGRIDGITKIKTAEALRGFTGGVLVGITDLAGNVLHTTKLHTYGVDGTAKPGGKSSRTEHWSEDVPKDSLDKAAGVVIWQSHQAKNRFPGAADWILKNWQCFVTIYKTVTDTTTKSTTVTAQEGADVTAACRNITG